MVGGFGVGSPALWIPAYAGMTGQSVMLALRQYPQRGHDHPVIADLIRNPEGQGRAAVIPSVPHRHTGLDPVSTGRGNNKSNPTESPSPLMETFAKLSVPGF